MQSPGPKKSLDNLIHEVSALYQGANTALALLDEKDKSLGDNIQNHHMDIYSASGSYDAVLEPADQIKRILKVLQDFASAANIQISSSRGVVSKSKPIFIQVAEGSDKKLDELEKKLEGRYQNNHEFLADRLSEWTPEKELKEKLQAFDSDKQNMAKLEEQLLRYPQECEAYLVARNQVLEGRVNQLETKIDILKMEGTARRIIQEGYKKLNQVKEWLRTDKTGTLDDRLRRTYLRAAYVDFANSLLCVTSDRNRTNQSFVETEISKAQSSQVPDLRLIEEEIEFHHKNCNYYRMSLSRRYVMYARLQCQSIAILYQRITAFHRVTTFSLTHIDVEEVLKRGLCHHINHHADQPTQAVPLYQTNRQFMELAFLELSLPSSASVGSSFPGNRKSPAEIKIAALREQLDREPASKARKVMTDLRRVDDRDEAHCKGSYCYTWSNADKRTKLCNEMKDLYTGEKLPGGKSYYVSLARQMKDEPLSLYLQELKKLDEKKRADSKQLMELRAQKESIKVDVKQLQSLFNSIIDISKAVDSITIPGLEETPFTGTGYMADQQRLLQARFRQYYPQVMSTETSEALNKKKKMSDDLKRYQDEYVKKVRPREYFSNLLQLCINEIEAAENQKIECIRAMYQGKIVERVRRLLSQLSPAEKAKLEKQSEESVELKEEPRQEEKRADQPPAPEAKERKQLDTSPLVEHKEAEKGIKELRSELTIISKKMEESNSSNPTQLDNQAEELCKAISKHFNNYTQAISDSKSQAVQEFNQMLQQILTPETEHLVDCKMAAAEIQCQLILELSSPSPAPLHEEKKQDEKKSHAIASVAPVISSVTEPVIVSSCSLSGERKDQETQEAAKSMPPKQSAEEKKDQGNLTIVKSEQPQLQRSPSVESARLSNILSLVRDIKWDMKQKKDEKRDDEQARLMISQKANEVYSNVDKCLEEVKSKKDETEKTRIIKEMLEAQLKGINGEIEAKRNEIEKLNSESTVSTDCSVKVNSLSMVIKEFKNWRSSFNDLLVDQIDRHIRYLNEEEERNRKYIQEDLRLARMSREGGYERPPSYYSSLFHQQKPPEEGSESQKGINLGLF